MPFGAIIAAVAPSLIGAAAGAMGGGKKDSTQSTRPYLPPEFEDGYKTLLSDALKNYNKPQNPYPTARAGTSSDYGGLFNNPQLMQLQQLSDRGAPIAPTPAPTPVPTASPDAMQKEMLGMQQAYASQAMGNSAGGMALPPSVVNNLMQTTGLKRFYSLSPEEQGKVTAANMMGSLKPDTFQSQYGFNPFSY